MNEFKKFNIIPKKYMGQNFLLEPSAAKSIVEKADIEKDDIILEIGSGLGIMTEFIALAAEKVYAVEKDDYLAKILKDKIEENKLPKNIKIINEDIFKIDLKIFAEEHNKKIIIIGNLPYNISSKIIRKLIDERKDVEKAVIMLQSEVAERLIAKPCCKEYGILTVILGLYADISKISEMKPHLFYPKPKVNSTVIKIEFLENPNFIIKDEKFLYNVIKAGFSKRRKNLKNALSQSLSDIEKEDIENILKKSGIDPKARAETLSVKDFIRLSDNLLDLNFQN